MFVWGFVYLSSYEIVIPFKDTFQMTKYSILKYWTFKIADLRIEEKS